MIKTQKDFIEEIRERLKGLNPYKIILFGSLAEGGEKRDSDIDLLVILDSEDICRSFEEKVNSPAPRAQGVRKTHALVDKEA